MKTTTSRVMEALTRGDLLTIEEMAKKVNSTVAQVHSAIWWLRNVGAIDVIEEHYSERYYFATPADDQRVRIIERRKLEERPRRR